MSNQAAGKATMIVHRGEELEPAIRSALASLLATEPSPAEVDVALNQLRLTRDSLSLTFHPSASKIAARTNTKQWLLVAASFLVFCMCGIASTEGWAQIAKDLSAPINEPQPLSTLAEKTANSLQPPNEMGFALRLVLIAHVTLLTLGLSGMAATWLIAILSYFLEHWRKSRENSIAHSTQRYLLFYSTLLYAVGIILGAVWAQAIWGRLWSWDPRETFGLFTIAFAVLWMRSIDWRVQSEPERRYHSATSASLATIAIGSIGLMFVLGNRYAAAVHSYGLAALTLPNFVFGLFAGCWAAIWISFALRTRFYRRISKV